MKTIGIVAEFNPLHNGHLKLLNFCKSLMEQDGIVVCVMSGNFVQRGEPAVLDKYTRAKNAIFAGADAVVELPTLFATANASDFAMGGVSIFNALNIDGLCCGSESGNAKQLKELSNLLVNPSPEFLREFNKNMNTGVSYASALSKAVENIYHNNLLDTANNLLATEYLNAITKTNSKMDFFTIKREDDFNCNDIKHSQSASAVRNCFFKNNLNDAACALPPYVFEDLKKADTGVLDRYRNFVPLFLSTLDTDKLKEIDGIAEGLDNRIVNSLRYDFDTFVNLVKTKRYTRARLNRIFLNAILNVTKEKTSKKFDAVPPLKLLAVKDDKRVIKEIDNRLDNAKKQENSHISQIFESTNQKADTIYNTMCGIVVDKTSINKLKKY